MWCLVLSKENECKCRNEQWTVRGGSETSRVHTFFCQCLLTLVNCANVSTTFLLGCTNDNVYTWLAFNPPPSLVSSLELKGFPWSCRVENCSSAKIGHIFVHFARPAYLTQLAAVAFWAHILHGWPKLSKCVAFGRVGTFWAHLAELPPPWLLCFCAHILRACGPGRGAAWG